MGFCSSMKDVFAAMAWLGAKAMPHTLTALCASFMERSSDYCGWIGAVLRLAVFPVSESKFLESVPVWTPQ